MAAPPLKTVTAAWQAGTQYGDWRRRLTWSIIITDLVALALAVYGTQLVWFSSLGTTVAPRPGTDLAPVVGYLGVSMALVIGWMWALSLSDSRSMRVLGSDTAEYRRVVDASIRVFGIIAILALMFKVDLARGYVLISLPTGVAAVLVGRWAWRQWLVRQRREGAYMRRVLLLGTEASVARVAHDLAGATSAGYQVVGACVPRDTESVDRVRGTDVPILGDFDDVQASMTRLAADTVIVTGSDELPATKVKELSWALESGRQHLVLSPAIADIAGPRIHTRPVAGLPFVHVETPRLSTGQRLGKRAMDLVLSVLGVVVLSPLLLVLAAIVKADGPGPVIFAQSRVGRDGNTFRMYKFRSMVPGAEQQMSALRARSLEQDGEPGNPGAAGNEVLFKLRDDPRVTAAGRWMRRYSLDELPQLFNVIGGSMSLVGPRPPLRSEVAQYEESVHRRFLMKPGITGLWQVSGRSSLSWDTTVRLDLSYVENYSVVSDLLILGKTVRAVVQPGDEAF